ncbi:MAG: putative lipid II flippase FtsW [Halobacteriovoraceae bacterium]|nr:putative lipid II flippase FtsW [Halobacteriovoraceae bacterium]
MEYGSSTKNLNIKIFYVVLAMLTIFGLIMVYSSSYIFAKDSFDNSLYFINKQLLFVATGVVIAFFVSKTKITFWLKYSSAFLLCCALMVLFTLLPHIGIEVKGATRWINVGLFNFQPSEIFKFVLLLFCVDFFGRFEQFNSKEKIKKGIYILLSTSLLLIQPDYGSFFICICMVGLICFISNFPRKLFFILLSVNSILITILLFTKTYRVKRLLTYLDPWADAQSSGFQIIQSYLAFAHGSIFGQGLGNSNEKLFYLPESHNDFIFSVIGEEFGFVGILILSLMFLVLLYVGLKLSFDVQEKLFGLVMSSTLFLIIFQAFLNMAVVLGLLPTKGLNLPFISYGGSSLISNFFGIGLVLSSYNSSLKRNF